MMSRRRRRNEVASQHITSHTVAVLLKQFKVNHTLLEGGNMVAGF